MSLKPGALTVQSYLRISPELVPEVYRQIDVNGDGQTSAAEEASWVVAHARKLEVTLDGAPLELAMSGPPALSRQSLLLSIEHPLQLIYTAASPLALEGKHHIQLTYGDNYLAYDEYYLSVADDLSGDARPRNISRPDYPGTYGILYQVPPARYEGVTAAGRLAPAPYSAEVQTAVETSSTQPAGDRSPVLSGASLGVLDMLSGWHGDLTSALLMLLLAVAIGALHALTPGHGKTVVAAYLVGTRGRVQDAVLLGGITTFTHTAGVVVLGLILLLVSNFSMPRALQPALQLLSGVLIIGLGGYLLLQRCRAFGHEHPHPHPHDHSEPDVAHGHHHHAHPPSPQTHLAEHAPGKQGGDLRGLVSLGVSGGLVPCPDALAILILAAGVGQVGLGLGLVASFSIGLASVLIGIGLVLVRMRATLDRSASGLTSSSLWTRWVPIGSAAMVVVIGVVMAGSSFGSAWV